MKKLAIIFVLMLIGLGAVLYYLRSNNSKVENNAPAAVKSTSMKITSPAFLNNTAIPAKYTCQGENINPQLDFSEIPPQAKSLALLVDDPDAPMGTWTHWVVFNMPPDITRIVENSKPGGVEGLTSFGKAGYGGPCPPSGTHRYFFKLYALDIKLDSPEKADKNSILKLMQGHILGQVELIGLYKKK
ncbi:MAG: YbhB/YbcL family Raf kinase inhibitor-like protein [Candidatus Levyibacteriota bacterium]